MLTASEVPSSERGRPSRLPHKAECGPFLPLGKHVTSLVEFLFHLLYVEIHPFWTNDEQSVSLKTVQTARLQAEP